MLTKTIPANEVDYITFETEPLDMKRARASMREDEFDDVMKAVNKMDEGETAPARRSKPTTSFSKPWPRRVWRSLAEA